ncbi:MAG: DNA-3-methyladenine glycosylase [Fuerstiella sp.]
MTHRLPPEFFQRDVVRVAQQLIGCRLCRRSRNGLATGIIVETEAYLPEADSASHAAVGPNRKNEAMFGPAGRAYVYTIHARQCFNVVTDDQGIGAAVLIRALRPLRGIDLMKQRRGTDRLTDLCRGPARLCEALDIGRNLNHWPLTGGRRLWLEAPTADEAESLGDVARSVRIGVTSAANLPLRFFVRNDPFVSGPKRLHQPD